MDLLKTSTQCNHTQSCYIINNTFQDNNGTIELDEFLSMMAMRMKANEKIKQVFDIFDTDCDG